MEIREYKTGNEKDIINLFKLTFNKEMTLDYWRWRFQNNPIEDIMIYLMWDNDLLVGHYAVSPNRLELDGKVYKSALSMTTMTHPNYGGQGIFTKLANELYEKEHAKGNLDVVWGFPNRNSHRGFLKNLGWKDITIIPSFSLKTEEYRFPNETKVEFSKIESVTKSHIDKRNNLLKNYQVKQQKNEAYYNWRYYLCPINDYHILANRNSDFIIVKEFRTEDTCQVDIVEWNVSKDKETMIDAINSIYSYYRGVGVKVDQINLWMSLNDDSFLNFELMGFAIKEPLTYMGWRMLARDNTKNLNMWHYQLGDSDVY